VLEALVHPVEVEPPVARPLEAAAEEEVVVVTVEAEAEVATIGAASLRARQPVS
jgi:hypothetical protein